MTRAAIPDPRDEACRDRETVRLPRSTTEDIDDLVDEGKYPNRSAFIRAGARLLIKCEREDVWPAFDRGREETEQEDEGPDSLQEMAEANAEPATASRRGAKGAEATTAADGGMAGAVDLEVESSPVATDARNGEDGYEFVADSPAVSESDIVTKLSSVMREATAGERAVAAS